MNTQTMTLNQIAGLTGKAESTIRSWITSAKTAGSSAKTAGSSEKMSGLSAKIAEAQRTKKPAQFTLEETIEIVKAGGNETLANLLLENAHRQQAIEAESTLTPRDLNLISTLIKGIFGELDSRVNKIENRIEERQALLPPPNIKPRDAINKLVRDYATRFDYQYNTVWNKLYTEFNYHYNVNVKTCASNRSMPIIDYIETEGMIDQLHAVAIKIFGE